MPLSLGTLPVLPPTLASPVPRAVPGPEQVPSHDLWKEEMNTSAIPAFPGQHAPLSVPLSPTYWPPITLSPSAEVTSSGKLPWISPDESRILSHPLQSPCTRLHDTSRDYHYIIE